MSEEPYVRLDAYCSPFPTPGPTDPEGRRLGKEVVVLDDYEGENHRFGVFDALTGEQTSNIRIMGNYESTRYVKGAIIPTVDMVET